jgi:hypothetical protein
MADRTSLRRIFDQVVPLALLAVAGALFIYAVSVATALRELRALEPLTHPDLDTWRCAAASPGPGQGADVELKPGAGAAQQPAGERSAACPPAARQARPQ